MGLLSTEFIPEDFKEIKSETSNFFLYIINIFICLF